MAKTIHEQNEHVDTKLVSIADLERPEETENRLEDPDRQIVRAIVTAIRAGRFPPPIEVFNVEGRPPRLVVVDGRSRIMAAKAAGLKEIMARVHYGTLDAARWAAAGANATPAQPRTLAEERRAVEMALLTHPDATDARVAEHVGCSRDAVREARKRLSLSRG